LDGSGASKNIVTAIDGGVFANNPALLAIQEALGQENAFYPVRPRSLKDIALFSIGTGHHMFDYAKEDTATWGVLQWGSRIFDLMTYASSQAVDSIISNTLVKKKHYLRVNIDIDKRQYSEMDVPTDGCYDYWQEEVNVQLLTNDGYIKTIEDFIKSSGL
jgi:patatin-like phospholipase/acyl hydrolase